MSDPFSFGTTKEEFEALIAPIELRPASGHWLTAFQALNYVEENILVSRDEAIKAVCRRAVIAIPVRCTSWSIGEDPHDYIDRIDFFRENNRKYDHFQRVVSRSSFEELLHLFEALGHGETTDGDWEIQHAIWSTGDFKVQLERDFSVVRFSIIGLQFDRLALEMAFTGKAETTRVATVDVVRKAGGRPQSVAWPQWIAELALYIHEHGYPEGEGAQGQEAIINAVADRLAVRGKQCPSRSTVQAAVQALLDRFRNP